MSSDLCVCVSFGAGVIVGRGLSEGLGYECVWLGPSAY
jgi:hypothetical protein